MPTLSELFHYAIVFIVGAGAGAWAWGKYKAKVAADIAKVTGK